MDISASHKMGCNGCMPPQTFIDAFASGFEVSRSFLQRTSWPTLCHFVRFWKKNNFCLRFGFRDFFTSDFFPIIDSSSFFFSSFTIFVERITHRHKKVPTKMKNLRLNSFQHFFACFFFHMYIYFLMYFWLVSYIVSSENKFVKTLMVFIGNIG